MTNLSEVPHDKIVGLRVISHRGTTGVVTEAFLDRRYVEGDIDCYMVRIEWDNGGISIQRHYMLESVEVIQ
jgi:hypothetical protein